MYLPEAAAPAGDAFRPRCYRCMRPVVMCFCADVPEVHTKTRLVILQHPRERLHPFGTARMVDLALPNARIEVPRATNSGSLLNPLAVPSHAAVLFPHERAIDLAALPPNERPTVLVALDGTWAHAKRLYVHNPWLQDLRHVRLHPSEPSRYRIRREPRPDYMSTVEAIIAALRILEPQTQGLDALLEAFTRMIDRQIACLDVVERRGRAKRPRQRVSRRLPAQLDAPGLVVAYCEAVTQDDDYDADRSLVQWTAVHVARGDVFEAVLRPQRAWPTPAHLGHMNLSLAALEAGMSLREARARFLAFTGPRPVLAAWSKNTAVWGRSLLPSDTEHCSLKIAYHNLRHRRPGLLEAVVRVEGLTPTPMPCHGRARTRLGNALALARWLRGVRVELTT